MVYTCLPIFILVIVGVINCVSAWNSNRSDFSIELSDSLNSDVSPESGWHNNYCCVIFTQNWVTSQNDNYICIFIQNNFERKWFFEFAYFCQKIKQKWLLCQPSVRPKSPFWFRSNTKIETQIGQYSNWSPNHISMRESRYRKYRVFFPSQKGP